MVSLSEYKDYEALERARDAHVPITEPDEVSQINLIARVRDGDTALKRCGYTSVSRLEILARAIALYQNGTLNTTVKDGLQTMLLREMVSLREQLTNGAGGACVSYTYRQISRGDNIFLDFINLRGEQYGSVPPQKISPMYREDELERASLLARVFPDEGIEAANMLLKPETLDAPLDEMNGACPKPSLLYGRVYAALCMLTTSGVAPQDIAASLMSAVNGQGNPYFIVKRYAEGVYPLNDVLKEKFPALNDAVSEATKATLTSEIFERALAVVKEQRMYQWLRYAAKELPDAEEMREAESDYTTIHETLESINTHNGGVDLCLHLNVEVPRFVHSLLPIMFSGSQLGYSTIVEQAYALKDEVIALAEQVYDNYRSLRRYCKDKELERREENTQKKWWHHIPLVRRGK